MAKAYQSASKRFPRYIDMSMEELEALSKDPIMFSQWIQETRWHERVVNRGSDIGKASFIRKWYVKFMDSKKIEDIVKSKGQQLKIEL